MNLEGWLEAHAREKEDEREQQYGQHDSVYDQGQGKKVVGLRS